MNAEYEHYCIINENEDDVLTYPEYQKAKLLEQEGYGLANAEIIVLNQRRATKNKKR
jgi:hypothetical protein